MKIKLLVEFGGRETGEKRYYPGDVWECDEEIAARLIANKQAEALPEPEAPTPPAPQKGKRK